MQVSLLKSLIEKIADPRLSAEWDRSGIQIAGTKNEIERLAVTLDPSVDSLQEALDQKADFILSHHPLSLTPGLPDRDDTYTTVLRLVLSSGSWLYAAHSSLDVQTMGPVSWLAAALNLGSILPLEPVNQICGYGVIGNLDPPLTWGEFQKSLQTILQADHLLSVGTFPAIVSQVAYCPGSGMSLAPKAFASGAQVFISGDLKFHQAQEIEGLGLTVDAGHYALEEPMMAACCRELESTLGHEIQVSFVPGRDPFHISSKIPGR